MAGESQRIEFSLDRLTDMAARGWHSGDNHIHLNYGGIFDATPESVLLEAEAEDLHVVNNLIANRSGGRIYDMKYFENPTSCPGIGASFTSTRNIVRRSWATWRC